MRDKFSEVAYKYITGFFLFDVVSTFFTLFTNYETENFYYLKLLRLCYFIQAPRILAGLLEPIMTSCNIRKQKKNMFLDLIKILYWLFAIMHIIACIWIYFGETTGENSWKVINDMNMSAE